MPHPACPQPREEEHRRAGRHGRAQAAFAATARSRSDLAIARAAETTALTQIGSVLGSPATRVAAVLLAVGLSLGGRLLGVPRRRRSDEGPSVQRVRAIPRRATPQQQAQPIAAWIRSYAR